MRADAAGRRDQKGNVHIFFIHKEGVGEVALVLAERLAVIAIDHPHGLVVQAAGAQPGSQRTQRRISIQ